MQFKFICRELDSARLPIIQSFVIHSESNAFMSTSKTPFENSILWFHLLLKQLFVVVVVVVVVHFISKTCQYS